MKVEFYITCIYQLIIKEEKKRKKKEKKKKRDYKQS